MNVHTTKGPMPLLLYDNKVSECYTNPDEKEIFMNSKLIIDSSMLEEIHEYIEDDNITDIDWNGRHLWIEDLEKGRYKSDIILSPSFINNLSVKLGNMMNVNFNRNNAILEAETSDMRISIWHEGLAGERSISIRKTPLLCRLDHTEMIKNKYCDELALSFLENCIKARCNMIIGGLPGAGKTEFLKYLTRFIPEHERTITIEDSQEIHFGHINPNHDCVEVKVNDAFPYNKAIKACLRHNAKWTILSEARGIEVFDLMNNLSNGTYCLTTLHTDNVMSIPDRLINMMGSISINDRYINNVYRFLDVGVIVSSHVSKNNKIERHIEQICVMSRQDDKNILSVIYDQRKLTGNMLTEDILNKFNRYHIQDMLVEQYKKKL